MPPRKSERGANLGKLNVAHPKDKAVEDGDAERDADYKEDSTSESDSDNSTSELMAEEKALLEPNKRQRVTKKAVAPAAASTAAPMRTPKLMQRSVSSFFGGATTTPLTTATSVAAVHACTPVTCADDRPDATPGNEASSVSPAARLRLSRM